MRLSILLVSETSIKHSILYNKYFSYLRRSDEQCRFPTVFVVFLRGFISWVGESNYNLLPGFVVACCEAPVENSFKSINR